MSRAKRLLGIAICIAMLISLFPTVAAAASFSDTGGHWAEAVIDKWADNGVAHGTNGAFNPNTAITRAECAAFINRVMKYPAPAGASFSDVSPKDWFFNDIAALEHAGVMQGYNGRAMPMDKISRQDAMVLLAQAFSIAPLDSAPDFADAADISSHAAGAVAAIQKLGHVSGVSGNKFNPKSNMTRAEIIQILNSIAPNYFHEAGEYASVVKGNAVVNASDVTLKNITIFGDLYIAPGVGAGEFHADKVHITGNVYVQGGGMNSVYLNDVIVDGTLSVYKEDGLVRIVASGGTSVSAAITESGAVLVTRELTGGGFETVLISKVPAGQTVGFEGDFASITNAADNAEISIKGNVGELHFDKPAKVQSTGTIGKTTFGEGITAVINDRPVSGVPSQTGGGSGPGSGGGGPVGTTPSGDATLKSLSIKSGADELLSGFRADNPNYEITVGYGTAYVTVTAAANSEKAAGVAVTADSGTGVAGTGPWTVNLAPYGAPTVINITVTAEDGTKHTYKVTISAAMPADSVLSSLSVQEGSTELLTGSQKFDGSRNAYEVTVDYSTAYVSVAGALNPAKATGMEVVTDSGAGVTGTGPWTVNLAPYGTRTGISILVTTEDGSHHIYTVAVDRRGPTSDKAITSFGFLKSNNPALPEDIVCTIDEAGRTIDATLPAETAPSVLTALKAAFTTTFGAMVNVKGVSQTSGTTANNFTNPVIYTVMAEDGTSVNYTVGIGIPTSNDAVLASLSVQEGTAELLTGSQQFDSSRNAYEVTVSYSTAYLTVVAAANSAKTKSVEVVTDSGTGVTGTGPWTVNLAPYGTRTGISILVTAEDGSQRTYTVAVDRRGPTSDKAITSFGFLKSDNPGLSEDAAGAIDEAGRTIEVTLPAETAPSVLTALKAAFTTTFGAMVNVNGVSQTSGTTANNFTNPVIYTAMAEDGTSVNYMVRVNIPASGDAILASLSVQEGAAELLTGSQQFDSSRDAYEVTADYSTTSVAITLTVGSPKARGVEVVTDSGAGVTGTGPWTVNLAPYGTRTGISILVTAEDGSQRTYTVAVDRRGPTSDKAIASFGFLKSDNPQLTEDIICTIDEASHMIGAILPAETAPSVLTALKAAFTTTFGAMVNVNGVPQTSGTTANNFTNPVIYTAMAEDGTSVNYTVRVSIPTSSDAVLASLSVQEGTTELLTGSQQFDGSRNAYEVTVDNSTTSAAITLTVKSAKTKGVEVVTDSGAGVTGTGPWTVNLAPYGTRTGISILVMAEDGSQRTYTVAVGKRGPTSDKAITSFGFLKSDNPQLTEDIVCTVDEANHTIDAALPANTTTAALTLLKATFTTTFGAMVNVNGVSQTSGTTANNFTNPVIYTAMAEDGTSVNYTVTVAGAAEVSIGSISDIDVAVGDSANITVTVDPSDAAITAVSLDESTAVAGVSGNIVTVTGINEGTTVITVTARKDGYTDGTAAFTVNVTTRQAIFLQQVISLQEAISLADIPDTNVTAGTPVYVAVAVDPADAVITAASLDESTAAAEVSGNIIKITGINEGTTVITVTARKDGYADVIATFAVNVSGAP
jgi:S-ribosylhomocysteine lyase LuxS involved in autoinducer biosynthesis